LRNVASLPCFDAPAFNWRAEFLRRVSVEIVEEEETEEEGGGGERERERERRRIYNTVFLTAAACQLLSSGSKRHDNFTWFFGLVDEEEQVFAAMYVFLQQRVVIEEACSPAIDLGIYN